MGHGAYSVFSQIVASGATSTGEFNLARVWANAFLEVPTMTSNTQLFVNAANGSGGTYRRIKHPMINSSTVSTNDFAIASNVTSAMIPIPTGVQYVKIETTATVDSGCTFRIHCSDS